jgi:hypothetical protein
MRIILEEIKEIKSHHVGILYDNNNYEEEFYV